MSYIKRNLLQDEEVEYTTNLHWIIFINPLIILAIAGAFIWTGINQGWLNSKGYV